MRSGLVSDVHNRTVESTMELALFRERSIEQVLTIGGTCDAFARTEFARKV